MKFPYFKYHPNPLQTSSVSQSDRTCIRCNQARCFIYTGPVYAVDNLSERLCPWCIANGEAAHQFGATFSDPYSLLHHGIAKEIAIEVAERTPGYISWQQEEWLSHCNDACEFHGDATQEDVKNASIETKQQWFLDNNADEAFWQTVTECYMPQGSPAFYKFKCRHCQMILLGWDCA